VPRDHGRDLNSSRVYVSGPRPRCHQYLIWCRTGDHRSSGAPDGQSVQFHQSPLRFSVSLCQNNNTFTWSGPSGVLDCAGQRRVAPAAGWCKSFPGGDGCHAVPLNAADSGVVRNLRGGKRLRLRFWKGFVEKHAYPFALNRPHIASFQLCSNVDG
jgi:hypothetical protein